MILIWTSPSCSQSDPSSDVSQINSLNLFRVSVVELLTKNNLFLSFSWGPLSGNSDTILYNVVSSVTFNLPSVSNPSPLPSVSLSCFFVNSDVTCVIVA